MKAPRPADAFIVVWLVVQIALPLHYYVLRQDPRDERFAWRMFSSLSDQPCQAAFRVGDREIEPWRFFVDGWVWLAAQGRQQVARRMARHLCDELPGRSVSVRVECPEAVVLDEPDACLR